MFFAGQSNSTSRHPHQFVGRVAIQASPPSIITDAVGMHSGVATVAARGGWLDGWLAAKGLRRGVAVVVSCGFGAPKERSSQSTRDHPARDTCTVSSLQPPCERHPPPRSKGCVIAREQPGRREVIGEFPGSRDFYFIGFLKGCVAVENIDFRKVRY